MECSVYFLSILCFFCVPVIILRNFYINSLYFHQYVFPLIFQTDLPSISRISVLVFTSMIKISRFEFLLFLNLYFCGSSIRELNYIALAFYISNYVYFVLLVDCPYLGYNFNISDVADALAAIVLLIDASFNHSGGTPDGGENNVIPFTAAAGVGKTSHPTVYSGSFTKAWSHFHIWWRD